MMGLMVDLENKEAAADRVAAAVLATRATAKAGTELYMFLAGEEVCRFVSGVAQYMSVVARRRRARNRGLYE